MTGPAAPRTAGDSGLLIPIPEAEAVVGELRMRHDPTAPRGIPAHVTILFPFLPREEIDDAVRSEIRELVGGMAAFDYRFSHVEAFGETNIHLAPEPAEAFLALTDLIARRWPEFPPYGGVIETVIPHLTVGDRLADDEADAVALRAQEALRRHGPITGRAQAVLLMTEDAGGYWTTDSTFAMGGTLT